MYTRRLCLRHLKQVINVILRHERGQHTQPPHVCIVGSGPAGFYTAQQLLKLNPHVRVDIYEKQPVPFGLVRFGVAPDHQDIKNVTSVFAEIANNPRCSYIGNVTVGRDITLAELRKCYTAVVLSYGADKERRLGIPGENLGNVISARNFVGWYNGVPEDRYLKVDLNTDTAVIIGHGNVALDVARILLTPIDLLSHTDITEHSLEALRKSRIKRVVVVGRRGPLQVAFTIREVREMLKLPDLRPVLHRDDYIGLDDDTLQSLPKVKRRMLGLLRKTALTPSPLDNKLWPNATKEWELRFRLSPLQILGKDHKVTRVKFGVNRLEGSDLASQQAVLTDQMEEIHCGLVIRSIGYTGQPIDPDIPFDDSRGVVDNVDGRVTGQPNVYCSGWAANKAVDVILTTMIDAYDVSKVLVQDLQDGKLDIVAGRDKALKLLADRDVQVFSFSDWEAIDDVETFNGKKLGKPREKITDLEIFMDIERSHAPVEEDSKYH